MNAESGSSLVIVTHDEILANRCQRQVTCKPVDWRLSDDQIVVASLLSHGLARRPVVRLSSGHAITSVLSVSLLSERLTQSIKVSGRDFLAADRVVESATPLPDNWLQQARALGLQMTQTTEFSTMLLAGEQMQLASAKAITSGYPFYGNLVLSPQKVVRPKELWLSRQLMLLLQVKQGDEVQLGSAIIAVAGELVQEPDQSFNPLALAPRALMHQGSLAGCKRDITRKSCDLSLSVSWRHSTVDAVGCLVILAFASGSKTIKTRSSQP